MAMRVTAWIRMRICPMCSQYISALDIKCDICSCCGEPIIKTTDTYFSISRQKKKKKTNFIFYLYQNIYNIEVALINYQTFQQNRSFQFWSPYKITECSINRSQSYKMITMFGAELIWLTHWNEPVQSLRFTNNYIQWLT